MIFVNRSSPARTPADSAPTMFFTGSLCGPVMMRPRESVLTAVVKKRSSKGASGGVSKTCLWNAAEKVCPGAAEPAGSALESSQTAQAASVSAVTKSFSFLFISCGLPWKNCLLRRMPEQCGARTWKYRPGEKKTGVGQ